MFKLFRNRVYTEKPFFSPTYELFHRFYTEYFIKHPSVKKLDYLEFGLCGNFPTKATWDIDIRLMGSPNSVDYKTISDFFRDIKHTGLNKYRINIDICCMENPVSIKDYNIGFKSNDKYLYLTTYVDSLKEFIQYDSSYYKVNDYTETTENIEQVSENLWKLYFKYDLKNYRRKYENRVVPDMIDLTTYVRGI